LPGYDRSGQSILIPLRCFFWPQATLKAMLLMPLLSRLG
jgi:hypothetical protein